MNRRLPSGFRWLRHVDLFNSLDVSGIGDHLSGDQVLLQAISDGRGATVRVLCDLSGKILVVVEISRLHCV